MRVIMSGRLVIAAVAMAFAISSPAPAVEMVSPGNSTDNWLGFMNVFELAGPDTPGAYVFGSLWGVPDLVAEFDDTAGVLTLSPNVIADPNEFWYQGGRPGEDPLDPNDNGGPGAPGNKFMDASLFVEDLTGALANETIEFTYTVLSNTLTSAHSARGFIRDFEPGFGVVNEATLPLTVGTHTVSLLTIPPLSGDPADIRPIQWGFNFTGENVWSTDVAPFGSVEIMIPSTGPAFVLGDANNDGVVNNGDIGPFADALVDPIAYQATFPGVVFPDQIDTSEDGVFNNGDINPFVDILLAGPSTATAVPEPSSAFLLASIAVAGFVTRRS